MAARSALTEVKNLTYGFSPAGMFEIPGASFMQLAQYDSLLVREKRAFEKLQKSNIDRLILISKAAKVLGEHQGVSSEEAFEKIQANPLVLTLMVDKLAPGEIEAVMGNFNQLEETRLVPLTIVINNRAQVLAGYEVQRITQKKERFIADQDEALQAGRIEAVEYQAKVATFAKKYDNYLAKASGMEPGSWVQAEAWEPEDLMDFPEAVLTEIEAFIEKETLGGQTTKEMKGKKDWALIPPRSNPPTGMPSGTESKLAAS